MRAELDEQTLIDRVAARMHENGWDDASSATPSLDSDNSMDSDVDDPPSPQINEVQMDCDSPEVKELMLSDDEQSAGDDDDDLAARRRAMAEAQARLQRPLHPRVAAITPGWLRMAPVMDVWVQYEDIDEQVSFVVAMLSGTYRDMNRRRGDGDNTPYKLIPFHDGVMPSDPKHGLPALSDYEIMKGLSGEQLKAYCRGYDLVPVPRLLKDRRNWLEVWIGVEASQRLPEEHRH
ncbi:hypothetical protein CPB85DRAFT_1260709 [Mucidula mucida]|nr:hypothetical protein CPB85DRAFT_1260709 [Mucidula mucida]